MRRSYDYHTNSQYGWNTTSHEYLEHITQMQRTPSVITDVPHIPNVQSALPKKDIYEEAHDDHHQQVNYHKKHASDSPKKVQFAADEKSTKVVKDGKDEADVEKDINMEADGFIKQKHRNFELYKWATFKKASN